LIKKYLEITSGGRMETASVIIALIFMLQVGIVVEIQCFAGGK